MQSDTEITTEVLHVKVKAQIYKITIFNHYTRMDLLLE
jgi:hypothetical protein